MNNDKARAFALEWVEAWNDKDIDRILAHYAEDATFHSPRIALVMGDDTPALSSKSALRAYWTKALAEAPNLYFEIETVYAGSNALTIAYTNHREQSVTECFIFNEEGDVITSIAAYA
jgi:hypothetical protein